MPVQFALEVNALDNLTTAFTWVIGRMQEMTTSILSQPVLLIPVAIFCCGAAIGLAMRLIRG